MTRKTKHQIINGKYGHCLRAKDIEAGDMIDDPRRCRAMIVERTHHYGGLVVLCRTDGSEVCIPRLDSVRMISARCSS